ncbi:ESAT-6-like protein EsxF [Mycobacterium heckeshornense]|uniref:RNA 2'-phosphotransferase n=1 Tax=Mycobacterium heckeshornense TaxID=110505 RepID=UPI001AFCC2E8|nr:RNA 2'-phosphotransferase [Mycobacterium heckeshornense]BCQ06863.1 ESAT-6-like protein EsxF [Mycobacterium heckeshornense]BCQ07796.1 ESAT-6-like protein EsxF [Mycobacterium heckeshornense]
MADGLIVEPAVLQVGTDQMSAALQQAAIGFIRHDDELAEAAPGWIGASQQALGELAARWELQHSHHKITVAEISNNVIEVAQRYVQNEDASAQALTLAGESGF